MRKHLGPVIHAVRDFFVQLLPIRRASTKYKFAFLVHSRNIGDIYKKYPISKYLPKSWVYWMAKRTWPVIVSHVTGLNSLHTGEPITGIVIGFPMTARQMLEDRATALRRVQQAAKLAEKMGAKIIGLGALTSSMSRGGLDVIAHVKVGISTGHAYTAYTVAQYVFKCVELFGLDKSKVKVAVVGATGSVGSTTTLILARAGFSNLTLIDLEHKHHKFADTIKQIESLNSKAKVETTAHISRIKEADIVVTATNAPEALVHADDLKSGAIVIDDAQPSDVAPDALEREDVLILEAGIVHTPSIDAHFNFGLKGRNDNFCCMCEIMILAANGKNGHYVIDRATLKHVDEIASMGEKLGFSLGKFQNFKEPISEAKIDHMKKVISSHNV